jgi:cytochrome P450
MTAISAPAAAPVAGAAPRQDSAGAKLSRFVGDHNGIVMAILRRVRPIVATRRFAVVTRADDVREVLDDHRNFTVALYTPKMAELSGPFILGLDDTQLYRHDDAALRAAVRAEDMPRIAELTLAAGRERVRAARGSIDIVTELADPVLDEVIAEYFGTPGPTTEVQLRWARDLFEHIFLNVSNKQAIRDRAVAAAGEMRPHLDALIAARRAARDAGEPPREDVLDRLLRASRTEGGLRDIAIRHNLIGLIAGWIPTVSKAVACALDELLRRPEQLAAAQRAAAAGDQERVGAHVFEALRFRPQTWALLRTCAGDRVVAAGTRRATTIPEGARVLVAIQSAMFDGRAVAAPRSFRVDRPWSDYLHFGHGLHTCFGLEINRVQIPALATALLEGPAIRRAPAPDGRLRWGGPYPVGLTVTR